MENEEKKSMHWAELLASRVESEKKEPFTITAGMTTSGPTHLGTLCEFLFPAAIQKELVSEGKKCDYIFIADIFDAFDSIPSVFSKYEKALAPHLGKPLSDVPDPEGCCASFGDHFLNESLAVMKKFGVSPKIARANEIYASGAMDETARFFLKNEDQARELVGRTSLKGELPPGWSPIMPVCQNCGRIATTRVASHDAESYKYVCDREVKYVKGCGFAGENKISDHKYKLTWRLHWPSWMKHFNTSVEGAGMDHHTRGGSWDTCVAVFKEMFRQEPPIGYKFGFILFKGRKYSKSKGIGMGVTELLNLLPAEVIAYILLKPDLQENIDIDPSPVNLLRALDDFKSAGELLATSPDLSKLTRTDRKRVLAFRLSSSKQVWKSSFTDILLYYELYKDWKIVADKLQDKNGVERMKLYVESWVAQGFVPEEYSFSFTPSKVSSPAARDFVSLLTPQMPALEIHNLVFDAAKRNSVEPAALFTELYQSLIAKPKGPKMGRFIEAIGVSRVKEALG